MVSVSSAFPVQKKKKKELCNFFTWAFVISNQDKFSEIRICLTEAMALKEWWIVKDSVIVMRKKREKTEVHSHIYV